MISDRTANAITDDNAVSFGYTGYYQDSVAGALPAVAAVVGATTAIRVAARYQ